MAITIEFEGNTYPSIKKLFETYSKKLGFNYFSALKYISRNNITPQEYIKGVQEGTIKPRKFEYRGKTYKSMTECVQELVDTMSVSQFITLKNRHQLEVVECLDRVLNGDFDSKFTINGKPYNSVEECLEEHGYRYTEVYGVFRNRKLYKDMTVYEFLEKYINGEIKHRTERFSYDGNDYNNSKELLEEKGFDKAKFYTTKANLGYENTIDLILDVEVGKVPESLVTVKKRFGVSYNGVNYTTQKEFFDSVSNDSRFDRKEYTRLLKNKSVTDLEDYIKQQTV